MNWLGTIGTINGIIIAELFEVHEESCMTMTPARTRIQVEGVIIASEGKNGGPISGRITGKK